MKRHNPRERHRRLHSHSQRWMAGSQASADDVLTELCALLAVRQDIMRGQIGRLIDCVDRLLRLAERNPEGLP